MTKGSKLDMRVVRTLGISLALMACGTDDEPDASVADTGTSRDAGVADVRDAGPPDSGLPGGNVPVPPMTSAFEWPDTEPNDTPEQAVPVGVFEFAFWMGFSPPYNEISSSEDVDYYVFRTPNAADMMSVGPESFWICWSEAIDLLDLRLFEVRNARVTSLVHETATTEPNCEILMSDVEYLDKLSPDSIYLLEVRAAPGVVITGDIGLYSA